MRNWLGLALLLTGSSLAAELDYALQPREIAPNTYVVEGSTQHFTRDNGGNIQNVGFIVTEAGVVVIDTGPSRLYGEQLRAAIGEITQQPIERVYITHQHPDHFLGNQAFADVDIYALPITIQVIREQGDGLAENLYNLVGDWMLGTEPVVPNREITQGSVEIGGHRLELLALSGHTGADLAILDHQTGVLFAGDLVFNHRAPTTPNAHVDTWLQTLAMLKDLDFKVLVPGHGPVVGDTGPMDATGEYLGWLTGHLQEAAGQGLSVAETLRLSPPARFEHFSVLDAEYQRSVMHLLPAMELQSLGAEMSP